MTKKIKIAFVGDISSSFIKRDYEILKDNFDVIISQPPKKKIDWIMYVFILAKKVKKQDITFSWFAGWHSAFATFFSKLFGKKSIVVVGGYDAAYVPEINYGAFTNLKEKIAALYIYKNVDKVLVVNFALKDEIIKNAKVVGNNIDYLPTGFDSDYWKPIKNKENLVITVAGANTLKRVKLKGLETFVRSAEHIPEAKFIVINVRDDAKKYLEKITPKNVEFTGFLSEDKVLDHYQKAKVYCQISLREGLPTALCEAMLCECIPVGSRAIGVTTAIGDTGFYSEHGDVTGTVDKIKKALLSETEIGEKARDRIKILFSENKRREGLKKLF